MRKLSVIDWIALVLLILGGLNWGAITVLDLNLVNQVLGGLFAGWVLKLVYALIGVSAVYFIFIAGGLRRKS